MQQDQPAQFVPFNTEAARAAAAAGPSQNPIFAEGQYLATITGVTYGPGFNDPTSKQMKVHMQVPQSAAPDAPVREQTDYITIEGGNRFALEASQRRILELGDLFGALTPTGMNATLLPGKQVIVTLTYKDTPKGPTNYVKSYHPAPQPQQPQQGVNPAGLPPAQAPYTPPAPSAGNPPPYAPWGGNPPAPALPAGVTGAQQMGAAAPTVPAQAPYPGGNPPPPPPGHVFNPPPSGGEPDF